MLRQCALAATTAIVVVSANEGLIEDEAFSLIQLRASKHGAKQDPTYESLTCPPGQKKDFFEIPKWPTDTAHDPATDEGPWESQMCGPAGYRVRDENLCRTAVAAALGGIKYHYALCPGGKRMWPSEGCFAAGDPPQYSLFYSKCKIDGSDNGGNTYDAGILGNRHRGICFGCVDDPDYVAPTTTTTTPPPPTYEELTCPPGKKKDFFEIPKWPTDTPHDPAKDDGPWDSQMCGPNGGYRLRDENLCRTAATPALKGVKYEYALCPGGKRMWPSEGCFASGDYPQYSMFYSKCKIDGSDNGGNTYDAGILGNRHRGICFGCVDDPDYVDDAASAVDDPHITTYHGKKMDLD